MWIEDIRGLVNTLKAEGVDTITLHWTVGSYNLIFPGAYHFQITGEGKVWLDPAAFTDGAFNKMAHAWRHNSRNIGISLCAMYGAQEPNGFTPKDLYDHPVMYGQFPPTQAQMDTMCALTSALVRHYGLNFDNIKTHYDLSLEDGYKGERWEFRFEKPLILDKVREIYEATKPTS